MIITNTENQSRRKNTSEKKPFSSNSNQNRTHKTNQSRYSSQPNRNNSSSRYGKRPTNTQRKPENFFIAECSKCNRTTKVPFKPDGVRPVYCKECFKEVKAASQKRN